MDKGVFSRAFSPLEVGDQTHDIYTVVEMLFADDSAFVLLSRLMEEAAQILVDVCAECGMTVSITKTNFMLAGAVDMAVEVTEHRL
jgi:hypothetical protein